MGELDGYTAVVTGSSRGIGRAVALELAAAGADVLIHAGSQQDAAEEVADEIRSLGRLAQVELAPLADPQRHPALVAAAWAWRGNVDVWVNNAGADVLTGEAATWEFDRKLEQLWQIDVRATMRLARLAGRRMKAARSDRQRVILNMGWDQAQTGMAGDSGEMFAAAKGAVMSFSRSLAKSLAPEVRVNCLAPGWIKTAWGRQASPAWQQRARDDSLLDRWGTPEDVARVARFLASPAAAFINGQIVPINGGWRNA